MEFSLLSELDSTRDDWVIRIRVCRMWESVNMKRNGELISLDMIFIDEKHNLIHATIRKNQVNRYRHMLCEGSMFAVKNFKVVESIGEYKPVLSKFKIIFLVTTSIKKLNEDIIKIPINGFQFIKPELIDSRVNDNTVLSDVIGCLCAIGEMQSVGANRRKRDIEVVTDYSVRTKITLWGDLGKTFDPNLYKKDAGPFIVIVTSTAVKKFRGEVSFSATNASKIYVNLSIEYVATLIQQFSSNTVGVKDIERSNVNSISLEEEMFMNRMNIKELLETEWNAEIHEYIVTVRAKIAEIDNFFGWYYISCNSCSKKVMPEDGVYMCNTCNKECKFPLVKFKIHVKVKDIAGESTFVLFNAVAEKLLDTSAHKLFNRQHSNSNDVPLQINSLCGKDFIFKLRLNNYNLKEGHENFTVSKIFIPDDKLEQQYRLRKDIKEPADISLNNLEDSKEVDHVNDGIQKRKRRNIILDDDELSDGESNQYKTQDKLKQQYRLRKDIKGKNVKKDEHGPELLLEEDFSIQKEPADVSLNDLEDSEEVDHINDGFQKRKKRNIILDDDELSDGESNQYKK